MRYTTVNFAMKDSAVRQMVNVIKLVHNMRAELPVDCPRHYQLTKMLNRLAGEVRTILDLPEYGVCRDAVSVKERPVGSEEWQMPEYDFRCPACNTYYRTSGDLPITDVTECGMLEYGCTCGFKGAMQYRGHHAGGKEE